VVFNEDLAVLSRFYAIQSDRSVSAKAAVAQLSYALQKHRDVGAQYAAEIAGMQDRAKAAAAEVVTVEESKAAITANTMGVTQGELLSRAICSVVTTPM
jgi:hypothetical protein